MNTTDCKGRLLAYEFGLKLIPARKPQLESLDALELSSGCGVTRPRTCRWFMPLSLPTSVAFHVDHDHGDDSAGTDAAPFRASTARRGGPRTCWMRKVHRPQGWSPLPECDH